MDSSTKGTRFSELAMQSAWEAVYGTRRGILVGREGNLSALSDIYWLE
jgi:hypothetical protein